MTEIFSKTALESLDDHSEAEEMPRVASPKLILVLCAMLAMLAVAIYWCAFGTINYKVTAQGVMFPFKADVKNEASLKALPDNGRELLVYVTFYDLRKLKIGQQVQVTPADLERESCGYAYGKITAIASLPTTRQAVTQRLKLAPLAAFIPQGEPVYEVNVVLDEKDGELVWSREKSKNLSITTGTLCDVYIITARQPVWRVLVGAVDDSVESLTGK
jgi:hypothetical protein